MAFLKPPKGEEWIERKREKEFWISDYPWERLYARLVKSYVGWWLYFRVRKVWGRLALLIDPLSCGGLWSHVHCFLYNWLLIDVWFGTKHRIWKLFYKKEWEAQIAFMRAGFQAMDEGYGDPMPGPGWFPTEKFYGVMLGKRYFKRVVEIFNETHPPDAAPKEKGRA